MPLYYYECPECDYIFEIFQHNSNELNIECKKCSAPQCSRLLGFTHNRTLYNARDNLSKRIKPDVDRIMNKVSKGSDKDFLDIAGD